MLQHTIPVNLALVLLISSTTSFAQRKSVTVCRSAARSAVKPMPKLEYECGPENDWDERQLKRAERVTALKLLMSDLEKLTTPAWWQTSVDELNACDFKGEAGAFTAEEQQRFVDGDYSVWLFGNNQVRLLLIPDPCYQTEYGGSNAFILDRKDGVVVVTQVLDGYFSRADNSVNLKFASFKGEQLIEVSTGSGGLNPTLTNYYFTVDPKTQKAVPKNLFASQRGPTNQISSAEPLEMMAAAAEPLNVIRGHSLANSFNVYVQRADGTTLSRRIKRWNGKIYR